jgi:hypothetical protein
MERGVTCTGFWWRNLRKRALSEIPGADRRIILRCFFRKRDREHRLY